jgi:hypothetical protein
VTCITSIHSFASPQSTALHHLNPQLCITSIHSFASPLFPICIQIRLGSSQTLRECAVDCVLCRTWEFDAIFQYCRMGFLMWCRRDACRLTTWGTSQALRMSRASHVATFPLTYKQGKQKSVSTLGQAQTSR